MVLNHGHPKTGEGFAKFFPQKLPTDCLTDRISYSSLSKKWCSVLVSRVLIRERLRWVGHVLWIPDCQSLSFFDQLSETKLKAGRPWLGWEDIIRECLREM